MQAQNQWVALRYHISDGENLAGLFGIFLLSTAAAHVIGVVIIYVLASEFP